MVTELRAAEATAEPVSLDTAAPVIEAQPVTQTESAPVTETTETARVDETTETPDPLAAFDEELVKASPRVKALLEAEAKSVTARTEESHRQQLAAERTRAEERAAAEGYARQQAELDEVERGSIANAIATVVDRVAYSDPEARERLRAEMPELQKMAETLSRTTGLRIDRQNVDTLNAYLNEKYPEYRIEPAKVAAFDAALAKGDFTARRQIEYDLIVEAGLAKERASMRAEIAKELKADAEKQLANERTRTAEAAAKDRGGPTAVAGRPAAVGVYRSRLDVANGLISGALTRDQARAYYAMPLSQLPEQ